MSFIHRFGASLNRHVHYHCCVIDGVFEPAEDAGDSPESVRFCPAAELTPEAVAAIAEQVRVRVLRWFARSGLIEPEDVREMLAWENSGFSLDAAVRVGAHDRAGLERLEHFCASPIDVRFMESYRRSWRRRQCLLLAESGCSTFPVGVLSAVFAPLPAIPLPISQRGQSCRWLDTLSDIC